MILAFLRAEADSATYQDRLLGIMPEARALIEHSGLEREDVNAGRRLLLDCHRGYAGRLFQGFPNDVDWHRARLTLDELGAAKYMNYPRWVVLSGRTRLIADGAKNVEKPWPPDADDTDPNPSILAIAEGVKKGESFPELIFVGEPEAPPERWVLVEGHCRATAYVYAGIDAEIEALVGFSPAIARWHWY
jgi:hypothetical protein